LGSIKQIACGYFISLAMHVDGTVLVWGAYDSGNLSTGTWPNQTTPLLISGLNGVTMIADGYVHVVALKSDGTVDHRAEWIRAIRQWNDNG
jgi:alpha-tubulin suppressor-like RCC1 family protein